MVSHPPTVVEASAERGRAARKAVPRSSHGDWTPAADRRDPVAILEEQNATRVPWLVSVRHARMRVSPFTFYRGGARIMAADLAPTPVSGLEVQLGGDAHLANFGGYASPERQLVFDANDFDETLRGPWEWDLKRLAASFTVAGQHLGLSPHHCDEVTRHAVASYREAMAQFAAMGFAELWYDYARVDDLRLTRGMHADELARRIDHFERRAERRTSLQALDKLAVSVDGRVRIRSDPPLLFPLHGLPAELDASSWEDEVRQAFEAYKPTLHDDRRHLIDRYRVVDIGFKVVGVGSVGTRCFIVLLEGRDHTDPLFIQVKEADASVLEEHLGPSPYAHHGRRVVEGQRMIQSESDIFLGWTDGPDGQQYYVRQLRDWKGSFDVEGADAERLRFYARLCGHTLARGHARSGDAAAIHAYAGRSDTLDRAIVGFAEAYAARNLADYRLFLAAIDDGRLPVAGDEHVAGH